MEVQAEISAERSKAQIGKIVDVIIDQVDEDQDIAIGRTKADAPEIDGTVELAFGGELEPGMIVEAKVVAADHYDLWAEPA
jgi:ribosomal protein S12 methylthiotransferase